MSAIFLHALAVHAIAAGHLTTMRAWHSLAAGGKPSPPPPLIPNPPPQPVPGLSQPVTTIIGWGKWGALICGIAGLTMCSVKMTIGHRSRASLAADGASGIPYVLGGLSLAAAAAGIVGVFL